MQYKNTTSPGDANLNEDKEFVSDARPTDTTSLKDAEPKTFWRRLLTLLKNRFVITFLVFLIIWLTAADNSYFVSRRLRKQVRELHRQEQQLQKKIESDSIQYLLLQHDPEAIERYGREHYFMRKDGEDVFVVLGLEE